MAMLGTFILLFGWFGFNAASTLSVADIRFAVVATNTAIAAAFGAVIAMFWVMARAGKPDPSMMANGMLAGLVAITAPCAFVQPWAAAVIGAIAGVLVIESVWFWERRAKIDDPVGAISVHGVCGVFGVLCVGIFADGQYGQGWNGTQYADATHGVTGVLYGGDGWGQLGAQAIGALTIFTVMFGVAYLFFKIQNAVMKGGIRPTADVERRRPGPPRDGRQGLRVHGASGDCGLGERAPSCPDRIITCSFEWPAPPRAPATLHVSESQMSVTDALLDILIVLVAAKVAAELMERLNIPAVVGEILAGILIGPSVLDLVSSSDVLRVLGEIGVILLLLEVGSELELSELAAVGRASLTVAIVGVIVPFVGGAAFGSAIGMTGKEAIFVGAALTATSVGITARVLGDLKALAMVESRTVLGAAVADDVIGPRHPHGSRAARHLGLGVGAERAVDRVRRRRVPGGHGVRRSALRPGLLRLDRSSEPFLRHARRDRSRVHARDRGARERSEAGADRRGVRGGARARSEQLVRSHPKGAAAGRAPLHPGLLPDHRHRGRRRAVREAVGARDRRACCS